MRQHALIASLLLGLTAAASAQDPDVAARRQSYLDLSTSLRMLCIAAAPGEEDAALLAAMRRGGGIETSVAFVTAGEGGKSAVGPERGDALRVVRMKECEAAARVLGAKTLYLHLPDFGAPKAAAPTLAHWGEEKLREALTRALRRFRPHVVVVGAATGTAPAGYRAAVLQALPDAVKDAADEKRFDDLLQEQLYPWHARRVFVACAEADAAATVDLGGAGPVPTGTFAAIGARALAQHRSYGARPSAIPETAAGFYRPVEGSGPPGAGSLVSSLVAYDREELGLEDEKDFQHAFAVEQKIAAAGSAVLEMKDGDPRASDRLFEALKALQALSATPLVSRRLAMGEWLEEKGYQDFFRRRADQLSIALRYCLGMRIKIDTGLKPRAEGQSFPVDVKLSLDAKSGLDVEAKVTNVGVRLLESPWFVKNYIEQSNRELTRERPVFAYFKARVKPGAPPTVFPAECYRTMRRFRPGLECEIGGRFRGERFAFNVAVQTPPVFPPVQLASVAVDEKVADSEIAIKFRTLGPLFRFGGRPEEEPLRFKLTVSAPEGVHVEPASVVVENRRSGEWSVHRFRVDGAAPGKTITFTARFIRKARPETLDETGYGLEVQLPETAKKP